MAKNLGEMVVKIAGDTTDLVEAISRGERSLTRFGDMAIKAGKSLSKFVTLPILGIGAASIKTAADFEASMLKVKAISGATEEQFKQLTDQARELGATTQFSASEAAEAMNFLAMAGFDTVKIMEAMPSVLNLAAASSVDLGTSADIVTNIMSGFNLTADELAGTVDILTKQFTSSNTDLSQLGNAFKFVGPVAQAFGLSIEETSAALGILSDAGIQGSAAGTGLRRVLSTLGSEADKLGIKTLTAEGKLRPLNQIIADIQERGITAAESMEIFGERGGPALQVLLSRGSEALAEMVDNLSDVDGLAQNIADTKMQGLNGQLKALRSAAEETAIVFGNEFLPMLTSLVSNITEAVRAFSQMDDAQKANILRIAGFAAAAGPALIALGSMVKLAGQLKVAFAFLTGPQALGALVAGGPIIAGIIATVALVVALAEAVRRTNVQQATMNKALQGQLDLEETLIQLKIAQADVQNKLLRLEELRRQQGRQGVAQAIANAEREIELAKGNVRQLVEIAKGKQANIVTEQRYGALLDKRVTDELKAGVQAIELQEKTLALEEEKQEAIASTTTLLKGVGVQLDDELPKYGLIMAAVERGYAKREKLELDWQKLSSDGFKSLLAGFASIGEALVEGELSWKSFAKIALNALAEILSAIGAELAAMAALSLIKGKVARAGIAAAASVAAFVASGAIKASVANLAEGGIVMPQPGGVPVTVAEAGVPEIVGPIDKVTRMLGATGLGGDTTPVHLVVNMDSRPFLDKVFDATRNRTVLISAGAVV